MNEKKISINYMHNSKRHSKIGNDAQHYIKDNYLKYGTACSLNMNT